jgi:CheY-like chemotaxis protein
MAGVLRASAQWANTKGHHPDPTLTVNAIPVLSPGSKAIALSAFARTEDRQRAIQAGFDRFLSKPLDGQELVATIAVLVDRPRKYDSFGN